MNTHPLNALSDIKAFGRTVKDKPQEHWGAYSQALKKSVKEWLIDRQL